MRVKAKKKKKKGRKGRSALKKSETVGGDTETNWDDDKTSFMTMNELQ